MFVFLSVLCSALMGNKYEVFFPNEFTFNQPWGEDPITNHLLPPYHDLQESLTLNLKDVPHTVAHTTHYKNAEQIISSGFKINAFPKRGSNGDYSYQCVNREDGKIDQIDDKTSLIPYDGSFSWWSIELNQDHDHLGHKNIHGVDCHTSFLFDKDQSKYGCVKFSMEFDDLISYYAQSREGSDKNVLYKVGGTLRYQREVCYVIIVCVSDDVQDLTRLCDVNLSELVISHPYNFFKGGQLPQPVKTSWDYYVFALYYPNKHPTKTLTLDPCRVIITEVKNHQMCLYAIRNQTSCPDTHISIDIKALKDKQVVEHQKIKKKRKEMIKKAKKKKETNIQMMMKNHNKIKINKKEMKMIKKKYSNAM